MYPEAKDSEYHQKEDGFRPSEKQPIKRQDTHYKEDLEDLVPSRLQGVTFNKVNIVLNTVDQRSKVGCHFFRVPVS